ncbi:MAG: NAD-dependent epimerase/dehydratase family protein [Bacteroidetes bacterium]|jgi:dihydroflavonol-4-reductase|nr:NAD-dependent epimerase/dehydratase family protein [Bacteroidota bacterium]
MKVAVTGATGHIGAVVCRQLIEMGYEVAALVRNDISAIEDLSLKKVKGDILNRDSLSELMAGCDAVIHTAATISLSYKFNQKVFDINVTGTKNVLDIAINSGIKKMVHVSSIHAFSQSPHNTTLDESRNFVNDSALYYDRSKRDGHLSALAAAHNGIHVVTVCPTSVLGPFDFKPSKLGKAIIDIYKGYVPAVITGGFDFVDVRDIANGMVSALSKGQSGQTYILGGKYYTLKQFSEIVLSIKGTQKHLPVIPISVARMVLPLIRLYANITGKPPLYDKPYLDILMDGNKFISSAKAQRELGYTARDLSESLADTIQWFKTKGKI